MTEEPAYGTLARQNRIENIIKTIDASVRLLTLTKEKRDRIHAANYKALRQYAYLMLATAEGRSNTMLKSNRRNLKGLSIESEDESDDTPSS